jgi:hypothetical protein
MRRPTLSGELALGPLQLVRRVDAGHHAPRVAEGAQLVLAQLHRGEIGERGPDGRLALERGAQDR